MERVAVSSAVELEVAWHLRQHVLGIKGKGQLIVAAFAKALEIIPRQMSDNARFDLNDILMALRKKHAHDNGEGRW